MIRFPFAAAALLASGIAAAEPATVIRATELRQDPASDAPSLSALAENARVDALARRGGWVQVKTGDGATGWVRILALRYGGGAARPGESGVAQLFNVARTGSSGTQVTTGVRGLDAEQLTSARPNPAELERMKSFAATRQDAASFAASAGLRAQAVEYPQAEEK